MLAYLKIFIDSLDELERLTDEEAGSLFRNLLLFGKFQQTGGEFFEPNFVGNESYVFPTFKKQIEREFESYEKLCNKNKENRKKKNSEDEILSENNEENPPVVTRQRRGQKDKDKENDYDKDNDHEKDIHPEGCEVVGVVVVDETKEVITFYLKYVNSQPSKECLQNLKEYEKTIGKDLVLKAINVAIDNNRRDWKFIRGIMRNFQNWGLNSLESWERHEAKRKESMVPQYKQKPPNGARKTSERTTSYETDDDLDLLWKNVQKTRNENEPLKS